MNERVGKHPSEGIDPATLRQWLDDGLPLVVLDVRQPHQYAESSIPGSINADVFNALKSGDPAAMKAVSVPDGATVVTVCNLGNASGLAAEQLQANGIEAFSLRGGLRAWADSTEKKKDPEA